MRLLKIVITMIACTVLLGCVNHTNDYLKKSNQISTLVVPSDVPALKQETYYPIPKTVSSTADKPISLIPPTLIGN